MKRGVGGGGVLRLLGRLGGLIGLGGGLGRGDLLRN